MFSFMCKLKFERWVSKRECRILKVCGSEWRCGWNWKPICCHLMRQQRYKMIYCIFVGRQYFPFRTITRTKWFCGVAIYCVFATSAYTKLRWTIATRSRQPAAKQVKSIAAKTTDEYLDKNNLEPRKQINGKCRNIHDDD